MKKFLFVFLFFFSFISFAKADILLWNIPDPRGIKQLSTTDFLWYWWYTNWAPCNPYISASVGFRIYDKTWVLTTLGEEHCFSTSQYSSVQNNLYTINLWKYLILIQDVYNVGNTVYAIIDSSTKTKLYWWFLYGRPWSIALIGNEFVSSLWSFNIDTGILSTTSTYTTINGMLPIWNYDKDGNGLSYLGAPFTGVDLATYYPVNYTEWGNVWTVAWVSKQLQIWARPFPIISYKYRGPYLISGDKVEYISYSTLWPYNYYSAWWVNTYFNLMTNKRVNNWEWIYYTSLPPESRFFLLFSANSQFYYVNDPAIINISFDIGPMVWYVLDTAWAVSEMYYLSWWSLYVKNDLRGLKLSTSDLWVWGTSSTSTDYDDTIWDFDTNKDGSISISEFFSWIAKVIKYFLAKLLDFFTNIKNLIIQLWWIFSAEVKTFSFDLLPKTYRNDAQISDMFNTSVNEENYHNTMIWKMDLFFKWFISFFILVIWISFFIFVNKKRKNG